MLLSIVCCFLFTSISGLTSSAPPITASKMPQESKVARAMIELGQDVQGFRETSMGILAFPPPNMLATVQTFSFTQLSDNLQLCFHVGSPSPLQTDRCIDGEESVMMPYPISFNQWTYVTAYSKNAQLLGERLMATSAPLAIVSAVSSATLTSAVEVSLPTTGDTLSLAKGVQEALSTISPLLLTVTIDPDVYRMTVFVESTSFPIENVTISARLHGIPVANSSSSVTGVDGSGFVTVNRPMGGKWFFRIVSDDSIANLTSARIEIEKCSFVQPKKYCPYKLSSYNLAGGSVIYQPTQMASLTDYDQIFSLDVPPTFIGSVLSVQIVCDSDPCPSNVYPELYATLPHGGNVSLSSVGDGTTSWFYLYPVPGLWFLTVPKSAFTGALYISASIDPCLSNCSSNGICVQNEIAGLQFGICQCKLGYSGVSCSERTVSAAMLAGQISFLALSNVAMVFAILIAARHRLYGLAFILTASACCSMAYHICDTSVFCFGLSYGTLHLLDFSLAITAIGISCLHLAGMNPEWRFSVLFFFTIVAVASTSEDSTIAAVSIVAGLGILPWIVTIILTWRKQGFHLAFAPYDMRYFAAALVLFGCGVACMFSQSNSTYWWLHSLWHISIMLAPAAIIMTVRRNDSNNSAQSHPYLLIAPPAASSSSVTSQHSNDLEGGNHHP